jgi:hypothetical protein
LVDFEYPAENGALYLDVKLEKRVCAIIKPYAYKYLEAKEMWEDTLTLLNGVNTIRDLEATLPTLVPYLPQDGAESTTALVPVEQYDKINRFFQVHKPKENTQEQKEVSGE